MLFFFPIYLFTWESTLSTGEKASLRKTDSLYLHKQEVSAARNLIDVATLRQKDKTSQSHTSVVETATAPLHKPDDSVGDSDWTSVVQHRMSFQEVQWCTAQMRQVRILPVSAMTHSLHQRIHLMSLSKAPHASSFRKSVSVWPKWYGHLSFPVDSTTLNTW